MLTIIIVSFNSASTLIECQSELLTSGHFPVIVVDNASTDGSAEIIAARFPKVNVMRMDTNLGYGRAANRALAEVHTPYAFLLNPDLQADSKSVAEMLDFAVAHSSSGSLFAPAVVERDALRKGAISREWIIGAAMLFKMKDFKGIGFFDENIFLYYEETDLCRRLQQLGKHILLNTDVHMHHLGGQSSLSNPKTEALKNWHRGWSYLFYLRKHGLIKGWWAPRRMYLKYALKAVVARSADKRAQYLARASGVLANVRSVSAFTANGNARCEDKALLAMRSENDIL